MKVWDRWETSRPGEVWSRAGIGPEPSAPDPGAGNNAGPVLPGWLAALAHVSAVFPSSPQLPLQRPATATGSWTSAFLQADFSSVAASMHSHNEARCGVQGLGRC